MNITVTDAGNTCLVTDMVDAVTDADAKVPIAQWTADPCFDWPRIVSAMSRGVAFDGQNICAPEQLRADGFECLGRGQG